MEEQMKERGKTMAKIIAKAWADEAFKQKLMAQPAETIREEGLDVPPEVELRVVECTDKVMYFVLPQKPMIGKGSIEELEGRKAAAWCGASVGCGFTG